MSRPEISTRPMAKRSWSYCGSCIGAVRRSAWSLTMSATYSRLSAASISSTDEWPTSRVSPTFPRHLLSHTVWLDEPTPPISETPFVFDSIRFFPRRLGTPLSPRRLAPRLSTVALLLVSAAVANAQTPAAAPSGPVYDLSAEQWRADLSFMSQEMQRRHKNLYHTVSAEKFRAAVADLDGRIPTL